MKQTQDSNALARQRTSAACSRLSSLRPFAFSRWSHAAGGVVDFADDGSISSIAGVAAGERAEVGEAPAAVPGDGSELTVGVVGPSEGGTAVVDRNGLAEGAAGKGSHVCHLVVAVPADGVESVVGGVGVAGQWCLRC
jgi:hypothetical protein